jgi:hypothetical protein
VLLVDGRGSKGTWSHNTITFATSAHAGAISRALEAIGVDVSEVRKTGELQILDARKLLSAFMVAGQPDALLFKSNVGDLIERLCGALAGRGSSRLHFSKHGRTVGHDESRRRDVARHDSGGA